MQFDPGVGIPSSGAVSVEDFTVTNVDTGKTLHALPVPRQLIDLMIGGGIFPLLEAKGLIAPLPAKRNSESPLAARASA